MTDQHPGDALVGVSGRRARRRRARRARAASRRLRRVPHHPSTSCARLRVARHRMGHAATWRRRRRSGPAWPPGSTPRPGHSGARVLPWYRTRWSVGVVGAGALAASLVAAVTAGLMWRQAPRRAAGGRRARPVVAQVEPVGTPEGALTTVELRRRAVRRRGRRSRARAARISAIAQPAHGARPRTQPAGHRRRHPRGAHGAGDRPGQRAAQRASGRRAAAQARPAAPRGAHHRRSLMLMPRCPLFACAALLLAAAPAAAQATAPGRRRCRRGRAARRPRRRVPTRPWTSCAGGSWCCRARPARRRCAAGIATPCGSRRRTAPASASRSRPPTTRCACGPAPPRARAARPAWSTTRSPCRAGWP